MADTINIFYEEPDPDRWFKYDRYPRKLLRKLIRGKGKPGGVMMIALQLMKGLDRLGITYRYNDYKYAKNNPHELIGVIGKPHLIFERKFKNPILFGAGVFSHPIDCLNFFDEYPNVKKMLVPGEWMKTMCEPLYGNEVLSWPSGIDTDEWQELSQQEKETDFLIYDKVRWDREKYTCELIDPIEAELNRSGYTFSTIRYGQYNHAQLMDELKKCRAVIFLCEHETQGQAYQQILSTNTPILAWDEAGYWRDPYYYPHRVLFKPVTSVPYWDERCGLKFSNSSDFHVKLPLFISKLSKGFFQPRAYITDNLTLEKSARQYADIYNALK
jgi:glycosyltransferase involved in cell wall biosynthesis